MSEPADAVEGAEQQRKPRTAEQRRQSLREQMTEGWVTLRLASDMAKEDPALSSLSVMALLRLLPDVELAHARYALTVAGLNGKTRLGDIDAETADSLVVASAEAQIDGHPTQHFPFWSEPDG